MDLSRIPIFSAISKRMDWLNQRQKVLAENVANANTPNFRPSDLPEQNFRDLLKVKATGRLAMTGSSDAHLGAHGGGNAAPKAVRERVTEVSPTGNAVNIEDQLMKVSETQADYTLMTNLYRKHLGMLKTAIGRHGG